MSAGPPLNEPLPWEAGSSPGVSAQRYRAYYDWPKPVEFDVELPAGEDDGIDGPEDLRDFLLDAAPFAKLSAVRVERVDSAAAETVSEPATPPESASAREGVSEAHSAAERLGVIGEVVEMAARRMAARHLDDEHPEAFDTDFDKAGREYWLDMARVALEYVIPAAGFRRDPEPQGDELTITYRNYRGEIADRRIRPMRVWFGATEWHPEPQWLLDAVDTEKGMRSFALQDVIDFGAGFRREAEDPETLRAKVRGAIYQALPAPIGHDDRRWDGSHGELTRHNYDATVDAATDAALQVFGALRGGEQQ